MGLFSKDIQTKQDLFEHTLADIYYAEKQITKALPKMIDKAGNPQLKQAFQSHLGETKQHVSRLERVFKMLDLKARGVTCEAIDGIISEAESVIGEVGDDEVRDAAMLASAQAVEHYEMTRYGTLCTWAHEMGRPEIASVLHETLEEEEAADEKLTEIAKARVNSLAA